MQEAYTADQPFDKITVADITFTRREFESCRFTNSDLSSADFSYARFIDCTFVDCNLSLAKLQETIFRDVVFEGCKMWGLLFYDCNKIGLAITVKGGSLNHSSFYQTSLKKTRFTNAQLQEVDWTGCDLAGAVFDACDLLNAKFENTNLEGADLRTAFHYVIDPEMNRIKKARFSVMGLAGLLGKYDIRIDG